MEITEPQVVKNPHGLRPIAQMMIHDGTPYEIERRGRGWTCAFVLHKALVHRLPPLPLRDSDHLDVQYWPEPGSRGTARIGRSPVHLQTPAARKRAELLPNDHVKRLDRSLSHSSPNLCVYGAGSYTFTTVANGPRSLADDIEFEQRWLAAMGHTNFPSAVMAQLGKAVEADAAGWSPHSDILCGALVKLAALTTAWAEQAYARQRGPDTGDHGGTG